MIDYVDRMDKNPESLVQLDMHLLTHLNLVHLIKFTNFHYLTNYYLLQNILPPPYYYPSSASETEALPSNNLKDQDFELHFPSVRFS